MSVDVLDDWCYGAAWCVASAVGDDVGCDAVLGFLDANDAYVGVE